MQNMGMGEAVAPQMLTWQDSANGFHDIAADVGNVAALMGALSHNDDLPPYLCRALQYLETALEGISRRAEKAGGACCVACQPLGA